jgi:ABC-type Fe3+/spermidine/putrescine transport system ATPase subunit
LTNILKVKNLSYNIGDKEIILNIKFSITKHSILALLGQSGSGKSTILKLIAGLLEPNSGDISIQNEKVVPPSEKLIPGHPKIKIVRQDNPLFPNITLQENIEYELRFYNEEYRNERVQKLLKVTDLQKVAHQLPRHSSEGEQQRTAIARALADEPALLLLDEPFSNLDFKNKSTLKQEIKQIVQEEEMACIFVTHDIADVFGTADELAILKNGKITQQDLPIHVFQHPKSIYEASITGDYNIFSKSEIPVYFGSKPKASKILVRPKDVEISEKGKFKGEIVKVINKGSLYEIELRSQKKSILTYAMNPYTIGETVHFDIKDYSEI